MPKEIERKYLVKNSNYKAGSKVSYIHQAYISAQKDRVVRVRVKDEEAFVTIKGRNTGATRLEFEYPIPVSEAKEIIDKIAEKPSIEKKRYIHKAEDGHTWEIDEFLGNNEGLVVAEIELSSEEEDFTKPEWLGEEVTNDIRYYNSNLIITPYKNWEK